MWDAWVHYAIKMKGSAKRLRLIRPHGFSLHFTGACQIVSSS